MKLKYFTGHKWWTQTNPAYKQACFRQARKETLALKCEYDYFISHKNKINNEQHSN